MADDSDFLDYSFLNYTNGLQKLNGSGFSNQRKGKQPRQPTINGSSPGIPEDAFAMYDQGSDEPVDRNHDGRSLANLTESSNFGEMGGLDHFQVPAGLMCETASHSDSVRMNSVSNESSNTMFTTDASPPKFTLEDYDAPQNSRQYGLCYDSQSEMNVDDGMKYSAPEPIDARLAPLTPFDPSYQSFSPASSSRHSKWLDVMNADIASPPPPAPALPEFEDIIQATRRFSDAPWSHVAVTVGLNGLVADETPVNNVNFHNNIASNGVSPVMSSSSLHSPSHGMGSTPHRRPMSISYMANRVSPQRLSVPEISNSSSTPASPSASDVSNASSNVDLDEVLFCGVDNCNTYFTGIHAKGNQQRHRRLKKCNNGGQGKRSYPCEFRGCKKEYLRSDALLKHRRNRHPQMGLSPAEPRKKINYFYDITTTD